MVTRTRRRTTAPTGITRYLQLYTVLSQALADGTIHPGSLLPSEPELVRRYRVSRTTVRRALARLEAENRIVRRRGSGTYARDPPLHRPPLQVRYTCLLDDLRAMAERSTVRLLERRRVATPEYVRRDAPEFGDTVLMMRHIRMMGSEPILHVRTYLPLRFARRLTPRRLGNRSVLVCLHELGAQPARGDQRTTAVAADAPVAKALKVAIGAPLIHVRRCVRDVRGRAIAHQDFLYRPERFELRSEFEIR